jgi:hypothetical protein
MSTGEFDEADVGEPGNFECQTDKSYRSNYKLRYIFSSINKQYPITKTISNNHKNTLVVVESRRFGGRDCLLRGPFWRFFLVKRSAKRRNRLGLS